MPWLSRIVASWRKRINHEIQDGPPSVDARNAQSFLDSDTQRCVINTGMIRISKRTVMFKVCNISGKSGNRKIKCLLLDRSSLTLLFSPPRLASKLQKPAHMNLGILSSFFFVFFVFLFPLTARNKLLTLPI